MKARNSYWVKCLDFKYLGNFDHINFQYLTYEITAESEKEAIEKARECYMRGQKETFSEEIPLILKLFSVSHKPERSFSKQEGED